MSLPRLNGLERDPRPVDYRLAALDCDLRAEEALFRGEPRVASTWRREGDSLRDLADQIERAERFERAARSAALAMACLLAAACLLALAWPW